MSIVTKAAASLLRATAVLVMSASAVLAQNGTRPVNVDAQGVILHGYDAVSYHVDAKAEKGSPQFSAVHEGATYHFVSAAHRDAFVASPSRFAPAFVGYCAMGVAVGKKLDIDPTAFQVRNGTLFVNVNAKVREMWTKDVGSNEQKARANWSAVQSRKTFDAM